MIELASTWFIFLIFMTTMTNHPFIFCMLLILCATTLGLLSGLLLSKWFTYAIILIFLGGMMVVFIYVTTLTANEKFLVSFNPPLLFALFLTFVLMDCMTVMPLGKKELMMAHLYTNPAAFILFFMMIYLLATLFTVIKLAESFKGALVKFL